jgi:hypothetical protein
MQPRHKPGPARILTSARGGRAVELGTLSAAASGALDYGAGLWNASVPRASATVPRPP